MKHWATKAANPWGDKNFDTSTLDYPPVPLDSIEAELVIMKGKPKIRTSVKAKDYFSKQMIEGYFTTLNIFFS